MHQFFLSIRDSAFAAIGYVILLLLPPIAVTFSFWRRSERLKRELAMPFEEMRRPAGEGLRVKLEELGDEIDSQLFAFLFPPMAIAILFLYMKPGLIVTIFGFLIACVIALQAQRKLGPLVRERANCRLGFNGERFVAEELNKLIADGFHVFHDVPFEKFNIDHVLVGPSGIFAVETKTRRKKAADGKGNHKVLFDGVRLIFPSGAWDMDGLEQARLNAKTLAKWLASATADQITALPILTMPGWYVERSAKSDVYVTNPKQIRDYVLSFRESPLSPDIIQRAVHQLEQKCSLSLA